MIILLRSRQAAALLAGALLASTTLTAAATAATTPRSAPPGVSSGVLPDALPGVLPGVLPGAPLGIPLGVSLANRLPRGADGVLRGRWDRLELPVTVPAGLETREITLTLSHISAPEAGPGSTLWLGLDGVGLVQLPLGRDGTTTTRSISLPAELFTPGRHILGIAVMHMSRTPDTMPADRLWTALDLRNSMLQLTAARGGGAPATLAALDERLSSGLVEEDALSILSAGDPASVDPQAGALAVQGWALRLGQRPLPVTYAMAPAAPAAPATRLKARSDARFPGLRQDILAGRHHILIGTRDQLATLAAPTIVGAISGPTLAVYPLDNDADHAVLLISGLDNHDVVRAAALFADTGHPLPGTVLTAADSPAPPRRAISLQDRAYRFADLGYVPPARTGGFPEPAGLALELPPDLLATPADRMTLRLHLDHGRVEAGRAAANILINNRFVTAVGLDNRDGQPGLYQLDLPLTALRPGHNRLVIAPAAADGGEPRHFRVLGDSTLVLPAWQRAARQPDLRRFALSGFPLVQSDDSSTELVAAGGAPETIAAVWTLAGKLAQVAGTALPDLAVRTTPSHADHHVLVAGPAAVVPAGRPGDAPEGGLHSAGTALLDGLLHRVHDTLLGATLTALGDAPVSETNPEEELTGPFRRPAAPVPSSSGLIIAASRRAPLSDKTLTVISASDPPALLAGIARLIQPAAWDGLSGGRATLLANGQVEAMPATQTFVTGTSPSWMGLPALVRRLMVLQPVMWAAMVAMVLLLFSQVTLRWVRRAQRREVGFDF